MVEDAPVNTGAADCPQRGLGFFGGTTDADQVAPLGGQRFWSPV